MKAILLGLAVMICWRSTAQAPTTTDTLALQLRVDSFAVLVQGYSTLIDATSDMDSIHMLATDLQERAAELITETERIWPIDADLLFEVELNNVPQLDMDPAISLEYQQRAHRAQQKIDVMMPPHYRALRMLEQTSSKIATVRKPERAHRLNEDLMGMDLKAREFED